MSHSYTVPAPAASLAPLPQGAYSRQSTLSPRRPSPLSQGAPRRESRPLRSSPLAGPSLALGTDGTLTGSDEDGDDEARRYRPNRISSTPDVTSFSMAMSLDDLQTDKRRAFASALASPTGTLRGAPLPPSPTREQHINETLDALSGSSRTTDAAPTPPTPAKQSHRLSLGFKRLSALPGLPSFSPKRSNSTSASKDAAPPSAGVERARTISFASRSSPSSSVDVPPVPAIPIWAKSAPNASTSSLRAAHVTIDLSHTPDIQRRPSTAPSTLAASSSRSHRRSRQTITPSQSQIQPQPPHHARPNTSTDPEANWMSAAAAPRFSRLGLKGAGVVLPMSAKEVRRKSTLSVVSEADGPGRSPSVKSKSSLRSLASVASHQSISPEKKKGKEREKEMSAETVRRMLEAAAAGNGAMSMYGVDGGSAVEPPSV